MNDNVIGFIQSLLSPEDAKVFCQGLYDVVEKGKEINESAACLCLVGEKSFYRDDRQVGTGLGFKYLCGAMVWRAWDGHGGRAPGCVTILINYAKQKRRTLDSLSPSCCNQVSQLKRVCELCTSLV